MPKYRKKFFIENEQQDCELRMLRGDGTTFWVHLTAAVDTSADDTSTILLILSDMSEKKKHEDKLELAASVFEHASEAIMITMPEGIIYEVNDSFTRITGFKKDEVIGKNPNILSSGHHTQEFYRNMWNTLIQKGSWSGEIWNKQKNGQIYAEKLTINTVFDTNGKPKHYIALFSDITELKKYEQELENIAHFDTLTGLPNRALLADRLMQGMALSQRHHQNLALIFIDLDGFKEVNDTYGHDIGDRLLVQLAKEMRNVLREEDTLARLGGDEFVAVLVDLVDIKSSLPMITRLLNSAAKKIQIDTLSVQVSASIGVTFYPQSDKIDVGQLLRQADHAMYEAKLAGKNQYHIFNMQQNEIIRERYERIERLRKALMQNEFILHYQPKVNMRTGEVLGVEALIRWQHPEKGLISPVELFSVLEGHSLSIEIGEWVMHAALLQVELWQEQGIHIRVSVNICARQLLEENFVERLAGIFAKHPTVKTFMLELEVLETSKLEDFKRIAQVMQQCKIFGLVFSLDNFGTGYSSLIYLKYLPIKYIKIDQKFVIGMLENPDDLSILDGVVNLAKAFKRRVIAEGVETLEHGRILIQLGYELGQGYAIAHPMTGDELMVWLNIWEPDDSWKNQHLLNTNQRDSFFATVEHRAWIAKVKAILEGESKYNIESSDLHECNFGEWLLKSGKQYLNSRYKEIDLMNKKTHIFADQLLQLHSLGYKEEALEGIAELEKQRDELLAEFDKIG